MPFDPSADFNVFDGVEPVDVINPVAAVVGDDGIETTGTASTESTLLALKRQIDIREIEQSGGQLKLGDVRWELPQADIIAEPLPGAIINPTTAPGTEQWMVLRTDDATLQTRWRCFCRKVAV